MPFAYSTQSDDKTVAVWQLTETVDELQALLPFTDAYHNEFALLKSDKRKKEFLAVRILLQHLLPDAPSMEYHATGKPYLTDFSYFISVSHTQGYAAVCISLHEEVGVDIERKSEKIHRVKHKFLHADEVDYANEHPNFVLLAWGVKEAVYKKIGETVVDFSKSIYIHPVVVQNKGQVHVHIVPSDIGYIFYYQAHADYVLVYG